MVDRKQMIVTALISFFKSLRRKAKSEVYISTTANINVWHKCQWKIKVPILQLQERKKLFFGSIPSWEQVTTEPVLNMPSLSILKLQSTFPLKHSAEDVSRSATALLLYLCSSNASQSPNSKFKVGQSLNCLTESKPILKLHASSKPYLNTSLPVSMIIFCKHSPPLLNKYEIQFCFSYT